MIVNVWRLKVDPNLDYFPSLVKVFELPNKQTFKRWNGEIDSCSNNAGKIARIVCIQNRSFKIIRMSKYYYNNDFWLAVAGTYFEDIFYLNYITIFERVPPSVCKTKESSCFDSSIIGGKRKIGWKTSMEICRVEIK